MAPLVLRLRPRSTHPTALSTRRARTAIYHTFPVRFNSGRKKIPLLANKRALFFYFSRGVRVMQIKKLKVRPQKSTRSLNLSLSFWCAMPRHDTVLFISFFSLTAIDPPVVLCGPQLASMLGCWAATKDVKAIRPCREHAQALFECMRTAVRFPRFFFLVSRQGN